MLPPKKNYIRRISMKQRMKNLYPWFVLNPHIARSYIHSLKEGKIRTLKSLKGRYIPQGNKTPGGTIVPMRRLKKSRQSVKFSRPLASIMGPKGKPGLTANNRATIARHEKLKHSNLVDYVIQGGFRQKNFKPDAIRRRFDRLVPSEKDRFKRNVQTNLTSRKIQMTKFFGSGPMNNINKSHLSHFNRVVKIVKTLGLSNINTYDDWRKSNLLPR